MAYIDYEFYVMVYGGKSIPETDFPYYANTSSAYVNYITQGRANHIMERTPTPLELTNSTAKSIRMAACSVAEKMLQQDKGGEITSQSTDGWSKSYAGSGKNADQILYDAARKFLATTGLLYRGIALV